MSDLQLDTLEAKGLIRLAQLQPDLEYLFRHALVQDTAYDSLLKQERKQLHGLVGAALEELYPDRRGDLAAVLAMHFEHAGEVDKSITYLIDAGIFALERNAIVEAHDLFSRADALMPPSSEDDDNELRRRRVRIRLGRARSGFSFISESDALAMLEPVVGDAEKVGDLGMEAELHISMALLRQFRGEKPETSAALSASLERVTNIATELGDPLIAALPESIVGLIRVWSGDLREGVALLERTAPQLEQKHDFVGSSFALVALAMGYARLGEFDRATDAARRATALAEKGDLIAKLDSLIGESTVRSIRGDLEGAVPIARRCTNLAEETGAIACVVASNFVLGEAFMRQGNFTDARIAFERGDEVANTIEDRQFRPSITAYMRSNAASMGEFVPAAASFEEALGQARARGDRWAEANVRWKRAETEAKKPLADRDASLMYEDFTAATTAFEFMGSRPYLARVLRGWGMSLRQAGDFHAGDEKLRRALALFTELGIQREAAEVTAELAGATGGLQTS